MLRIFTVLLFIFITLQSKATAYEVFEENGKVGLKNEQGTVLLPASFQALGWSDGSFSVVGQITGYKLGENWGLINLKKHFITKAEFESLIYTGGDRVIVFKKTGPTVNRFGCIDLKGNITVPFHYDGIKIQGLQAIVFNKNGVWFEHGVIDLENKEIIPLKFKNIYPIGSLRYAVENFENKTALFSEQGKKLTDFVIDSISPFKNGLAIIYQNLKQGLIDREGEIKVLPQYREIRINEAGSVSVRWFNEWKILNGENQELKKTFADHLYPLSKDNYVVNIANQKGIVDHAFNFKVPPLYEALHDYYFGKIIARQAGKSGIIRTDKSEVLPFIFDSLVWDGKFIRTKEKMHWSLYDTFGVQKTSHAYEMLEPFNGTFFPVKYKGYWGAVNRYGEEFIHCVFDSLGQLKEERMVVKFKNQFGVISLNEDWLVAPQPYPITLLNLDKYLEWHPSMCFLKDYSGELIYFTDNRIEISPDYLLEFLPNGTEKTISLDGQILNRTSLTTSASEKIFNQREGLQGIKRDGKYGFVDSLGRLRIANRYEDIGEFNEGLAPVKILGKWGFVNIQDKIVINPSYEFAERFQESISIVKRNGLTGLIDKEGTIVLALRYDSIQRLKDQKFLIVHKTKQGLADHKGKVIIEPDYDEVDYLGKYIKLKRNGKFGLLTVEGLSTIPLVYDDLIYDEDKDQYLALKRSAWIEMSMK